MDVIQAKGRKVPINDNVSLIVREISIHHDETSLDAVELREFLKEGEVEGHGVFIPFESLVEVRDALNHVINRNFEKSDEFE